MKCQPHFKKMRKIRRYILILHKDYYVILYEDWHKIGKSRDLNHFSRKICRSGNKRKSWKSRGLDGCNLILTLKKLG